MILAYDIRWIRTFPDGVAADAINATGQNYDGTPPAPVGDVARLVTPAIVAASPTLQAAVATFAAQIEGVLTAKVFLPTDPWRVARTVQLRAGVLRIAVCIYSTPVGQSEKAVYTHTNLANATDPIGAGLYASGPSLDALMAGLAAQ